MILITKLNELTGKCVPDVSYSTDATSHKRQALCFTRLRTDPTSITLATLVNRMCNLS